MSINQRQLRKMIEETLFDLEDLTGVKYSDNARELLMMTAAVESDLGTFWYQQGGGPALGIFQMEPATYDDIFRNYIRYRNKLEDFFIGEVSGYIALMYDLRHQILMARIHYLRVPEALPTTDLSSMAGYWKKYYNTEKGAGTVSKAVDKYRAYCL